MVILRPFWLKMAWFGSFEHYNWLNMGQYVCLRLSIGEYQWDVVISMDNYHVYHTWPSKLALDGRFWGKFHSIWANLSHSVVGSLWSGASHNIQKLAKPQQHVLHEILTPLSRKIIFIRAIFLVRSHLPLSQRPPVKASILAMLSEISHIWAPRWMWMDESV